MALTYEELINAMVTHESIKEVLRLIEAHWGLERRPVGEGSYQIIGSSDLHRFVEEVEASLDRDASGFTAVCMLEHAVDMLLNETISLHEYRIGASEETKKTLALLAQIESIIRSPEVVAVRTAINRMVAGSVDGIGVAASVRSACESLVAGSDFGGLMNKAAAWLKGAISRQFSRTDTKGDKFLLNEWIYGFSNMEAVVRAVHAQPVDGVSLCMVFENPLEYSYFVIAAKVGNAVYTFNENNGLGNREQLHRRRNPGRDLDRRLEDNYFPYSIFDMDVVSTASGSGQQLKAKLPEGMSTAVVLHDGHAHQIRKIVDLQPVEIVWLVLLTYRLKQDAWDNRLDIPDLSFTGSMVNLGLPSGEEVKNASIVLAGGQKCEITAPALHDIAHLASKDWKAHGWEQEPCGHNQALVADVLSDIPSAVVDESSLRLLRRGKAEKFAKAENEGGRRTHIGKFGEVQTFSATLAGGHVVGTKREIEQLQIYEARKRLAASVQTILNRDFSEKQSEVWEWLQRRVSTPEMLDRIQAMAVDGVFMARGLESSSVRFGNTEDVKDKGSNIVRVRDVNSNGGKASRGYYLYGASKPIILFHEKNTGHYGELCAFSGVQKRSKTPFWLVNIEPETNSALCDLLMCKPEDLPRPIRRWTTAQRYIGNSILSHIDPVDMIENPWCGVSIAVAFYLSENSLKRWREMKQNGEALPAFRPWVIASAAQET